MLYEVITRFFQTNNAENIKYGSTGIGLAYTKALVEIHKGRIEVDSQEGVGTIFTVTLSKGKAHLDNRITSYNVCYTKLLRVSYRN